MKGKVIETTDEVRLATYSDGSTTSPTVVLSSSLGADATMWWPQVPALAERFHVLRYDARGHGQSDAGASPMTIERAGRDVLDILDAYDIESTHLVGLSLGGMVAQWLAANAPERIERLVLANTAPVIGTASGWADRIARVRAGGVAAIADELLARWFSGPFRESAPDVIARARAMLLSTSTEGYAETCAMIQGLDLHDADARIGAPTLLVAGTEDVATTPEDVRAIGRAMRSPPELVTLAAAHLSNIEAGASFTRALLGFLS
jgi:3-oxoadipate enol-lactonase